MDKQIVTMLADPPWDPYVFDEEAEWFVKLNLVGIDYLPLEALDKEYVERSNTAPSPFADGSAITIVNANNDAAEGPDIIDYDKEEPGDLASVGKARVVFTSYGQSYRNGTEIVFDLGDQLGFAPFTHAQLKVTISKLTKVNLGPDPMDDITDMNNSFWQSELDDCKNKGDDRFVRRMGSNEPGANWPLDSPGHKWNGYNGWDYLFTATEPNDENFAYEVGAKNGKCLQLSVNKQMKASQGVILGDISAHQKKEVARWTNPTGVQFEWTTKNTTKDNAKGLKLKHLWLVYKEPNDGVPRYCPLIYNFTAQGFRSVEGHDLLAEYAPKNRMGRIRLSLSPEDCFQVAVKGAVAIGMILVMENAKQGAVYWNTIDIFNFRLLYYDVETTRNENGELIPVPGAQPTLPQNSLMMVPSPYPMSDWDEGNMLLF